MSIEYLDAVVRGNKTSQPDSRYTEVSIGTGRFLLTNAAVVSPLTYAEAAKIVFTWETPEGIESEDIIRTGHIGANESLVAENVELVGPGKLSGWCETAATEYWFQFTYRRIAEQAATGGFRWWQ